MAMVRPSAAYSLVKSEKLTSVTTNLLHLTAVSTGSN